MSLLPVNMLWIGEALGRIEQLSIKSYLAAGHEVRLHCYGTVKGVPAGVRICHAEDLLPRGEAEALRHFETGSFALASDLFRFRLQQAGAGLWSDIDVICLRPIEVKGRHLFGWESKRHINGAVLYCAPDSLILRDVMAAFVPNCVPPWLSLKRKLPFQWKRLMGQPFGPRDLPWGSFGPRAITWLARKHGELQSALPADSFYPVALRDARRIFEKGFAQSKDSFANSYTVHLWNERLKDIKTREPEHGSLLDGWYRKFEI